MTNIICGPNCPKKIELQAEGGGQLCPLMEAELFQGEIDKLSVAIRTMSRLATPDPNSQGYYLDLLSTTGRNRGIAISTSILPKRDSAESRAGECAFPSGGEAELQERASVLLSLVESFDRILY